MTTSNANEKLPEKAATGQAHAEAVQTKLYFPSILGYEKIARGAAEALGEQIELPPDRIEDLKTAVAEACMNAIEHGNSLDRALQVTVVMVMTGGKLEVRVADVGRQEIPETLPTPEIGRSMRGWGMFFIKNLVDEMELRRLPDGGNEVRMAIYLGPTHVGEARNESSQSASVASYDKPSAVTPVGAKPSAVTPSEKKPGAVVPPELKSRAVQPTEKKPGDVTPVSDTPTAIITTGSAPSDTEAESKPDPDSRRSDKQTPVASADETAESNDDATSPPSLERGGEHG
jgi:serine/threonine-protein kinase RsbW